MERVFTLKRLDEWCDVDDTDYPTGDLSCDAFELCNEHLLLYFDVEYTDIVVYVVLSTEEHPQSYGVRKKKRDYLDVEGQKDDQYVDEMLIDEVVAFAKEAGRVGEYIYLSLEFPNEGEV